MKRDKKTRKTTLFLAIIMCIIYTFLNCLLGILFAKTGTMLYFDSTLTSEWFDFWKWVVVSGGVITIAKVVKGNTNSDDDEINSDNEEDEEN